MAQLVAECLSSLVAVLMAHLVESSPKYSHSGGGSVQQCWRQCTSLVPAGGRVLS